MRKAQRIFLSLFLLWAPLYAGAAAPSSSRAPALGFTEELQKSLKETTFKELLPSHIKVLSPQKPGQLRFDFSQPLALEFFPAEGSSHKVTLPQGALHLTQKGPFVEMKYREKTQQVRGLSFYGPSLKLNGQVLSQRVEVWAHKMGLQTIFHVELEDYVSKVLPHEMSLSWPLEALKAQAIAIRTYALYQAQQRRAERFHVRSDIQDQVFKWEPVKAPWQGRLRQIVEATRGEVLLDARGQIASIFYHADCGGTVERTPWVWSGQGVAPPIQCPHHSSTRWSIKVNEAELAKLSPGGEVTGVRALATAPSGRVQNLQLMVASGEPVALKPEELRRSLGYNRLKSTRFSATRVEGGFEFKGVGHGHGVGLCQHGSKAWAARGKTSREILGIYYPSLKISSGDESLASL